jgi:hypothetical protein
MSEANGMEKSILNNIKILHSELTENIIACSYEVQLVNYLVSTDVIPAKPALVKTGGGNLYFYVIPAKAGIQQLIRVFRNCCLRNRGGLCVRLFIKTSIISLLVLF